MFCNNTICQDEKYFRNPEQFIPERWLRSGGERGSIHPFSCLPFGQGTRSCIGQRFSELETYILITKILLQYKIYKADNQPVYSTYKLFATPVNPVKIGFEKRWEVTKNKKLSTYNEAFHCIPKQILKILAHLQPSSGHVQHPTA